MYCKNINKPFHEKAGLGGNANDCVAHDARRPMHRPNPRSLAPSFPASSSPQKGRARSCSSHSKPPSLALHPDLLGFLVFASSSFLLFLRYSLHTALFQPPFGSYTRCATPEPLHTHNKPTSIGYSHESRQSQQLLIIPRSVESVHPAFIQSINQSIHPSTNTSTQRQQQLPSPALPHLLKQRQHTRVKRRTNQPLSQPTLLQSSPVVLQLTLHPSYPRPVIPKMSFKYLAPVVAIAAGRVAGKRRFANKQPSP